MPHSAESNAESKAERNAEKNADAGKSEKHALWTLKYAPHGVGEIAGNEETKETVKKWAFDWQRGKKGKPILLFGPPGCGKTALVRALAAEMNWTLSESNASTDRGGSDFVKLVSANGSDLYGSTRLLFIDEIDAVFDRVSRGEGGKALATALVPILEERSSPIILAAENAWEPKLAPLRAYCSLVELKRVNWRALAKALGRIAENEKCGLTPEEVEALARNAGGDLRAAINDLQASSSNEKDGAADANGAALPSGRDRKERVFETLRAIFHAKSFREALAAADASGEDLDMLVKWVEENVPREYENAGEVAEALDRLSQASVFQARIMRSQNWSLLKYVRALAFAGVAAARRDSKPKFVSYSFPSVIRSLSDSKKNRALMNSGIGKIKSALHCPRKQALETALTFGRAPGFATFFSLTPEETELFSSLE